MGILIILFVQEVWNIIKLTEIDFFSLLHRTNFEN